MAIAPEAATAWYRARLVYAVALAPPESACLETSAARSCYLRSDWEVRVWPDQANVFIIQEGDASIRGSFRPLNNLPTWRCRDLSSTRR
jgi:hypothetical protein